MSNKNFILTEESKINAQGVKLFRIKAIKSFNGIREGELGGWVEKESNLHGNAWVYGNARVSGDAEVSGNARVYGDARVSGNADYCVFQSFGSENRTTTFFKTKEGGVIQVICGCFSGTLDEFTKQVEAQHGDNHYSHEYRAIIEVVKIKFKLKPEIK